jgi:hypothetical protein
LKAALLRPVYEAAGRRKTVVIPAKAGIHAHRNVALAALKTTACGTSFHFIGMRVPASTGTTLTLFCGEPSMSRSE